MERLAETAAGLLADVLAAGSGGVDQACDAAAARFVSCVERGAYDEAEAWFGVAAFLHRLVA